MKKIMILCGMLLFIAASLPAPPVQVRFQDMSYTCLGPGGTDPNGWLLQFVATNDDVIDPPDVNGNPTSDDYIPTNPNSNYIINNWGWVGFLSTDYITAQEVGMGAPGEVEQGDKVYTRVYNAADLPSATMYMNIDFIHTITDGALQNVECGTHWLAWAEFPTGGVPIPPGEGTATQNNVTIYFPQGHDWTGTLVMTQDYSTPPGKAIPNPHPLHYNIDASGASGSTWPLGLTFKWDPTNAAFGGDPPDYYDCGIWHNHSGTWQALKDDAQWAQISASFIYDFDGLDPDSVSFETWHFSDWGFNKGETLPVELSAFTATYMDSYTLISWTTASETDVLGFYIYRNDIDEYETADKLNVELIDGHGTTTEPHSYEFQDIAQLDFETTYYYWLESVDYGGGSNVYGAIAYTPEEGQGGYEDDFETNLLMNQPNPFSGTTTIKYAIKGMLKVEPVTICIYNTLGQLIKKDVAQNGVYQFDASKLPTGIYFYQLKTENFNEIKKMMVIR